MFSAAPAKVSLLLLTDTCLLPSTKAGASTPAQVPALLCRCVCVRVLEPSAPRMKAACDDRAGRSALIKDFV